MSSQVQGGIGDLLTGPVIPLVAALLAGAGYAGYNAYNLNMANTPAPTSTSGWFFPNRESIDYSNPAPSGLASDSLSLLKAANSNVRSSIVGATSPGWLVGSSAVMAGPDALSRQRASWAEAFASARKPQQKLRTLGASQAQAKPQLKLKTVSLKGFGASRIAPSSILSALGQSNAPGRPSWTAQANAAASRFLAPDRRSGGLKLGQGKDQLYMSHVQSWLSGRASNSVEQSASAASQAFETGSGSQAAASANVPTPTPPSEGQHGKVFLLW